jgi:hypothetical protein
VATFGDTILSTFTDLSDFPYTQFVNTVIATSDSTLLTFSAYQVPSFFLLDDISVIRSMPESIPEPSALALFSCAILATALVSWRRKAKN